MSFLNKNIERVAYLYMLISINLGFSLIWLLKVFSVFIPKTKTKDLIIFLHAPVGSDGYFRRFQVFFQFLENDGITYDFMPYLHDDEVNKNFNRSLRDQYLMYPRILWKRLFQVLKIRSYRHVFIQRNLFPTYPDLKVPHLEKLARKLCDNITIDFWDPVHHWQPELTYSSFNYADKISADNLVLFAHYEKHHNNVRLWPIAVDINKYIEKVDYGIGTTVKLFYTGSMGNVKNHLTPLIPILEKLSDTYPIELTIVGNYAPPCNKLKINHVLWEHNSFYKLMSEADIGLFPYFGDPDNNNYRVAGKTLDYLATGLPFIGVKEGLPYKAEPNKHLFALNENSEWESKLIYVIEHEIEREKVGKAGRNYIIENFSLEHSYKTFNSIVFEEVSQD